MKKFSAHHVFPGNAAPIKKGIIRVEDNGTVLSLKNPGEELQEEAGLEFHNGIICPQFVNLLEEFSLPRFFKLFPELEAFHTLIPENTNGYKAIFEWIKTIQQTGSELSLEALIKTFTYTSAKIIELGKELGSLSIGSRPGLLLISGIDFENLKLTERSSLKKLI